jgi:hypothetical protein
VLFLTFCCHAQRVASMLIQSSQSWMARRFMRSP